MDFPPILILVILWLVIGLPLSKLNKAAKQQQAAKGAKPGTAKTKRQAPAAEPQKTAAAPAAPAEPARPTVMQPTITVAEHDDSVYMGSLNAITGEGYDPCHEEQLSTISYESAAPAETAVPGLQLSWTGNEIVRGVIMSEILNRKQPGFRRS